MVNNTHNKEKMLVILITLLILFNIKAQRAFGREFRELLKEFSLDQILTITKNDFTFSSFNFRRMAINLFLKIS